MSPPASVVRSEHVSDVADLPLRSPSRQVHSWLREGRGLLGWGVLATRRVRGADALRECADWFEQLTASMQVHDDVRRPGSGPIAFVSGAFDPERSDTVIVVPEVVLGRDEFGSWITYTGDRRPAVPEPARAAAPGAVRYRDGSQSPQQWMGTIGTVIEQIRSGRLDKAVLSRDVVAECERPLDARYLIERLTAAYSSCWTYSVDGLVGATPELLLRLIDGHVYSRVLAGTEWGERAYERLRSPKNLEEHAYAAASAAASLEKVTIRLDVPGEPKILELPNVSHLATEIRGDVADGVHACDVAAAMHPTAAVGGTPTDLACELIREVEGMDRGRYAGPVGWIDTHGNGEFGIALRGGQIEGERTIRLMAGCGLVGDSEPATELAESANKLLAMQDALASRPGTSPGN